MAWEILVNENATVNDTVDLIISTINKYTNSPFVSTLTKELLAKSPNKDAFLKNLFDYVCENVTYQLDPEGHEMVVTPQRLIRDGKGDCKKITTLIASVLSKAGIPPLLKVISYDGKNYEHIYVIVPVENNKYIVLDPVNKCQYNKEIPHKVDTVINLKGEEMNTKLSLLGKPRSYIHGNILPTDSRFLNYLRGSCESVDNDLNAMGAAAPAPISAAERNAFLLVLQHNWQYLSGSLDNAIKTSPAVINYWWSAMGGQMGTTLQRNMVMGVPTLINPVIVSQAQRVISALLLALVHTGTLTDKNAQNILSALQMAEVRASNPRG